jgi:hypothetical protein
VGGLLGAEGRARLRDTMVFKFFRPAAPWICLFTVLLGYLFYLARIHPANNFGRFEDDTVYFSSAKALAEGRGYILPSFPGTPRATKYPVLLPWLLSWIWRINPSFPSNISLAVWVTPIFGCWFLAAAFEFLRRRKGISDWTALAIVALCAFHPQFLLYSAQMMTDVPFAALALTAVMLADSALRREGRIATALAAGLVAGLSLEMRVVGLAVIAGILAAGALRRAGRQAAISLLAAAPFLIFTFGGTFAAFGSRAAENSPAAEPGWTQTLYYTTSYLKFWRLCVPNFSVFLTMLRLNVQAFLQQPGGYLVMPLLPETRAGAAIAIIAGIVRQARAEEWKPIHFTFVFYTALILPWNYPLMGRFLLLFLPLFYAGLWVEGKYLLGLLGVNLRSGRPLQERILAGVLSLGVAALAVAAVKNYCDGFRPQLTGMSDRRAALLVEKKEGYDWIRRHADPDSTVVAYEDAALYLYTGRISLRPIEFSTEGYYRQDARVIQRDVEHITGAARHVRARYWLMAADDYGVEGVMVIPLLAPRIAELKSALPEVFRSHEGNVRIYDLSCLLEPQNAECRAALPALFPRAGPE